MIWYVDIEHPRFSLDRNRERERQQRLREIASRFEQIASCACRIVHYTRFDGARVAKSGPTAIILSGQSTMWPWYDMATFEPLFAVLRGGFGLGRLPVLGTCGGHQLLALAFGAPVKGMRWVGPGEPNVFTSEGWQPERGFKGVDLRRRDPLFRGLPKRAVFLQSHHDHIVTVPPGFLWLASNATCRVQAMRHRSRPLYGVQFHPEWYHDEHPHGRRLLENFFSLCSR
jgi:GMP synthase-like glutamine amidotransferase